MIVLFPNTSRMYFYWQQDREAIIYTLTGDLNSEGWFQNDYHVPLDTIHLWHHLQESRNVGVSMTHCHSFGNIPYFGFSQPVGSRRAWNLHHLSALPLQCGPLSTVTHMVVNFVGWVSLALRKSHFMKRHCSSKCWGYPLATTWGSHILPWERSNESLCFHPGSGRSTTVGRTCWCAKKGRRAGLQSNCHSTLQRLKFKWNVYMYTFLAHCL